jgi:hypothetical protein
MDITEPLMPADPIRRRPKSLLLRVVTAGTGAAPLANVGCGNVEQATGFSTGDAGVAHDGGEMGRQAMDAGFTGLRAEDGGEMGTQAEDGGPMGKVAEDAGDDSGFVGDQVDDAGPVGFFVDAGLTIDDAGAPSDASELVDVVLGTSPFMGGDASQ